MTPAFVFIVASFVLAQAQGDFQKAIGWGLWLALLISLLFAVPKGMKAAAVWDRGIDEAGGHLIGALMYPAVPIILIVIYNLLWPSSGTITLDQVRPPS